MPTAPTPKDPSTARVIRDTLEMESFATVVSCRFNSNNFLLQFLLKIKKRLRQERLTIVKLELLSPIMLYIVIPLLFFNIFKLRARGVTFLFNPFRSQKTSKQGDSSNFF